MSVVATSACIRSFALGESEDEQEASSVRADTSASRAIRRGRMPAIIPRRERLCQVVRSAPVWAGGRDRSGRPGIHASAACSSHLHPLELGKGGELQRGTFDILANLLDALGV